MDKVSQAKILHTFIRQNRFFVKIEFSKHKVMTIPRAHFIWLFYNPGFQRIPRGYVIHHLDGDQTNDDISNLALMYKKHHLSYHSKIPSLSTDIQIEPTHVITKKRTEFFPVCKPWIYKAKNKCSFQVCFYEEFNGERQIRRLSKYQGRRLETYQDAEWAQSLLWPEPDEHECPRCGGKGLISKECSGI